MVLNYEMTDEEIVNGKFESKRVAERIRCRSIKFILVYFTLSVTISAPIFIYVYNKDASLSNGIKVLITSIFIISLVAYLIKELVEVVIDKKIELEFKNSIGKIVKSHYGEATKVRIELSNTIKVKNTYEVILSYSSISSIREDKKNLFIQYTGNKLIFIPEKAFKSEEEKYRFIKTLEKYHTLYSDKHLDRPSCDEYEKIVFYSIKNEDIKNIVEENEDTFLAKKTYSMTKKKSILVEFMCLIILMGFCVYLRNIFSSMLFVLLVFLMIYYYNKKLLPILVKENMVKSLKKEIECREEQYIAIKEGKIYFCDIQKILVQNLNEIKDGKFIYRDNYLIHNIGDANNFYIPYRAFKDKKDMEEFTRCFK